LQLVARAVGVEPHVIRRRNLLTKADLPTEMVTGPTISNLTAYETHERALEHVDIEAFRAEQTRLRGEGRYLGFGMATFMEHAPGPPNFSAAMGASASPRSAQRAVARLEPDGTLTVFTSQMPHGQSHQTTLAQLAADQLGVGLDKVRIVAGDTARTPFNLVGTGGSRAARLGSGAVIGAAREIHDRVARIYAHMKEVAVADVVLTDGEVMVRGVPASAVSLATIAATGYTTTGSLPPDMSPGFECSYDFGIPDGGWAQATHCCWVEVDVATGEVQVLRYFSAEDCGEMINPAIVEGQVRGGIVQGIGNVLFERVVYDADGQFLTTTFMDYLIPGAVEMPSIECNHLESPPEEPVDHRGVGEGGAVGAPAALTNAIEDALAPFEVTITDQYLPPSRILELIGTI
jgi:carbon-monoxide dehydrogenase large subunit